MSNQVWASDSYPLALQATGVSSVQFLKQSSPPLAFLNRGILYEMNDGILYYNGQAVATGSAGNVTGPNSSTNNAFAIWNGTSGNAIKDSSVLLVVPNTSCFGIGATDTMASVTTSTDCLAYGPGTMTQTTTGSQNNAFGSQTLASNVDGNDNNGFGYQALMSNTSGSYNDAFGTGALQSNIVGIENAAFGYQALANNTADSNAAFGFEALTTNSTGVANSAFGDSSLSANTTGVANTAVGYYALSSNTTGSNNNVIGYGGFSATATASNNVSVGSFNFTEANSTCEFNTCLGNNIGANIASNASNNVFVGHGVGSALPGGNLNTVVGYHGAFSANGTFTGNTIIGANAGSSLASGTHLILIGNSSAQNSTSGSNSIVLGDWVGSPALTDTIHIGDTQTTTFIAGIRGVTTVNNDAIAVLIDSAGQLGTTSSSEKYKENIKPLGDTVDSNIIYQLRPVEFDYKSHSQEQRSLATDPSKPRKQLGLIAEEVEKVCPNLCVYQVAKIPIEEESKGKEKDKDYTPEDDKPLEPNLLPKVTILDDPTESAREYARQKRAHRHQHRPQLTKDNNTGLPTSQPTKYEDKIELYTVDYSRLPILLLDQVQKLHMEIEDLVSHESSDSSLKYQDKLLGELRLDIDGLKGEVALLKQAVKAFLKISEV